MDCHQVGHHPHPGVLARQRELHGYVSKVTHGGAIALGHPMWWALPVSAFTNWNALMPPRHHH